MLVGVPLGVASRRGGKSSGFVFTILLVFVYYFLSSTGIALGHQNKLPAFLAVWSANMLFAVGRHLSAVADGERRADAERHCGVDCAVAEAESAGKGAMEFALSGASRQAMPRGAQRTPNRAASFRAFSTSTSCANSSRMFLLVLAGFVLLMIVFTFFDLVGDILRNHIALATVGDYLLNLTPSMLYQIAPLAVLIAVLVTFGVLNRNSEIIAMKATGISLYRLVVPIVSIAAFLAVSLFLFDQYYLPQANRRQEALRNVIKGRPPQTYLHPEAAMDLRAKPHPGEPGASSTTNSSIPTRNEFANLSVFEFNPATFSLTRRIFAAAAVWDDDSRLMAFRERLGARH